MDTRRPPVAASFASWSLVVAAVIGTGFIGQQRSHASGVDDTILSSADAPQRVEKKGLATVATDVSRDADEDDPDQEDALQLVPAIYAWDPDVRFVYFRHVSKWM